MCYALDGRGRQEHRLQGPASCSLGVRQEGQGWGGLHLRGLRKSFAGSILVGDKTTWSPFLKALDSLMWLALELPLSQATLLLPQPSCHSGLCQHLLSD